MQESMGRRHDPKMALIDEGTLDTVFRCLTCHREYRYTWDVVDSETSLYDYREFREWALQDAEWQHTLEGYDG